VRIMSEEIVGVFNVLHSVPEEQGVGRSCAMFLTDRRVIAIEPKGINLITIVVPIIAFLVGFTGFLLKNFVLFFIGMGAGIVSALVLVLVDSLIRHRGIGKAKRLTPDEILKVGKQNFEIPYSKISKVEITRFEGFRRGSLLLPSLPEYNWSVEFVLENARQIFILESDVLYHFIKRIQPFVPEIVETE